MKCESPMVTRVFGVSCMGVSGKRSCMCVCACVGCVVECCVLDECG